MEPDYKKKDRTAQPKPKTCKELYPNGSDERLACCAAGNKTTWSGDETTGICKCNDNTKEWKNGTCVAKSAPKICTPACSATQICTDGTCVDTQETINAKIAECEKDILKEWNGNACIEKQKEKITVPLALDNEQVSAYIKENSTCKNQREGNDIISEQWVDENTYEVVCKKSTVYYLQFKKVAESTIKYKVTGLLSEYRSSAVAMCQGGAYGVQGILHADGSGFYHCSGITEQQCQLLNTKDPYIRFVYTDVPGHGVKCWVYHE